MRDQTEELSFLLPVREFPDRGTKWLLEFGENVKGLLQIVARDLVDRLDFSQLEKVNKSFIPDNLREQESDIVYLVPFSGEDVREVMIYVLIEHQSTVSHVMGFRVLFYMVQIWDAQRREYEDSKVPETQWRFRPIIPIVFHTGSNKWNVPIRMDWLMDLPEELSRFVPLFDTLLLDVKGGDEEELLREGHPFGWILSVIRKENADKEELASALARAAEKLSQLPDDERHQWKRAMYYLVLLIYHRRSPEEHEDFLEIVEKNIKEKNRRKEIDEMGLTIAEKLIQDGALKAKREDILRAIQVRFDFVPESVGRKVKSINSMSRLDAIFDKAIVANRISDIEID